MASQARQLADKSVAPPGRRNLIINGAMQVAQRGTSHAITSSGGYTLDRWHVYGTSGTGLATFSQSGDAPAGFATSLKVDVTTADASLGSNDDYRLRTVLEAQNLQHLDYGSSSAKSITISFWVKSNKTGTYTLNIYEADSARIIGAEYTINSASTWEKKEVTFAGDTGGGINNDNGPSMYIQWVLGCGSNFFSGTFATSWQAYDGADYFSSNQTNFFDSTSNELYITGVQMEVGSTATEFEHRSYGEELALCQRYCIVYGGGSIYERIATGHSVNSTSWNAFVTFPVEMRTGPTESTSSDSDFALYHANTVTALTSLGVNYADRKTLALSGSVASGLTTGRSVQLLTNATTNARLTLSAEL